MVSARLYVNEDVAPETQNFERRFTILRTCVLLLLAIAIGWPLYLYAILPIGIAVCFFLLWQAPIQADGAVVEALKIDIEAVEYKFFAKSYKKLFVNPDRIEDWSFIQPLEAVMMLRCDGDSIELKFGSRTIEFGKSLSSFDRDRLYTEIGTYLTIARSAQ